MRTRYAKLFNSQRNKTALVIGNGPSLLDVPLGFLKKYASFGSNRIYLLPDFTPTYYVCINSRVVEQNKQDIQDLKCIKFIEAGLGFKDDLELNSLGVGLGCFFSYTPEIGVWEGFTATYVALQLAFYMGFTTILLVGCDHRYVFKGPHNTTVFMKGDDPNHFSPAYFRDQYWDTPNFVPMEEAYRLARKAYELDHRKIINLTKNSALDIFEKGQIEDWNK